MHVFTYGTLMFEPVWKAVVGRTFGTAAGKIEGFAIYRVRDQVFPGIVATPTPLDDVPGLVYLDVDDEAVARLDEFEDDFYERRTVSVVCDDGQRRVAQAYVVSEERRHVLSDEGWTTREFLDSDGLHRFFEGFAGFQRIMPDDDG